MLNAKTLLVFASSAQVSNLRLKSRISASCLPVSRLHHVLVHGADLLLSMVKVGLGWLLPFDREEKPFCGMWMSLPRLTLFHLSSWSRGLYCYLWRWKSLLIKLCIFYKANGQNWLWNLDLSCCISDLCYIHNFSERLAFIFWKK